MAGNLPELLNAPLPSREQIAPPANTPYVKQYNEAGELVNPVTKDNPYLHLSYSTRSIRRGRDILIPHQLPSGRMIPVVMRRTRSQKRKQNWHLLK